MQKRPGEAFIDLLAQSAHMHVDDVGLRIRAENAEKVAWSAQLLGIEHLLDRRPRQLSVTSIRDSAGRSRLLRGV